MLLSQLSGLMAVTSSSEMLIASITIFALAVFVGVEIITKIPPTLHTPLMSGSNAISGITLVGAVIASGGADKDLASWLGFVAIILATINVVGGFLVTHRMLQKFRR
ncbi:MAG: NAD(P) transhydrogenase subunit alpha [Planctomycetaceae bacterium]